MEKIEKVASIINRITTKRYPNNVSASLLVPLWSKVVGNSISSHTRPISYKNGQLVVACDSQVWCQELSNQKSLIIEKAKGVVGEGIISDVNFYLKKDAIKKQETPKQEEIKISEKAFAFAEMASETVPKPLREQFQRAILSTIIIKIRRRQNNSKV
jgi:hypothetical protein